MSPGRIKPLQGVRIADFTVHAAGPFSTHMLALMGAECIKIESNRRLDVFRRPHPVYGRMEAASFSQVAGNKKSILLDLKHPRAVELAKRLVAVSDIVCESFRPGVMDRLGLGYDVLKSIRPDVVMVSISACGQTGPERSYAGYAPLFGATGGVGTLTGYADGPPVELRHVMDHSTGLNAAAAMLSAFYHRKKTGRGQHVDLAAREVATSFIGDALLQQVMTGRSPGRQGNDAYGEWAPHNVYPCAGKDNWISIAVTSEVEWQRFAVAAGRTDWLNDPAYSDRDARWHNRAALDIQIADWTRTQTREVLTGHLQQAGVAAFPSCTTQDIVDDPHLNARGAICTLEAPDGSPRKVVGPPWRFSTTPGAMERWTPALGQHNQEIFGDLLGLSGEEISALVRDRVIY